MEKVKKIAAWVFGIIFLLGGLFSFASSFLSGLGGVLAGLFLLPPAYDLIQKKAVIFANRKIRIAIIAISILIFIFSSGAKTYSYDIKSGNDDPQAVIDFQKDLRDLIVSYKEAQIRTYIITQIKFGGAELEEAQKYVKETEDKWKEVEKNADKMKKYADMEKESKKETLLDSSIHFITRAFAEAPADEALKMPESFSGNSGEVQLSDPEKNLIQTDWDKIEVEKAVMPDKTTIELVQNHFGVSAKKAQELIEDYHGGMAKFWTDEEKYYQSKQNFVRAVGTSSSVALTVGGLGITYAGFVEFAATGTALSGLKLAGETAVLAVVKADAIMEVMETGVIVATGDENQAASITKAREFFSPILKLISIKDLALNPTLADGGNLVTVNGLVNDGTNKVMEFVDGEKAEIKIDLPRGPKMTADGMVSEYFPQGFQYDESGYMWGINEKGETKTNTQKEEKKADEKQFESFEGCQFKDARVCDRKNYAIIGGSTNGRTICKLYEGNITLDCDIIEGNPYEYSDEYKAWVKELDK